jgi:hypothetical protein
VRFSQKIGQVIVSDDIQLSAATGNFRHVRLVRSHWAAENPVWSVVVGVCVFGLSALLMPTAPGMGDCAELIVALSLAGIPHPTGYPFYTLAGHVFVRLVHGMGVSWTTSAGLWSGAGAAVAAAAYTRIVQHLAAAVAEQQGATDRPAGTEVTRGLAIAFPVIALVLNPVWIDAATVAEVYSWTNAWLAVSAAFMLGKLRALGQDSATGNAGPEDLGRGSRRPDVRAAAWWGLLCGLCGTGHATSILYVVPMSFALIVALVRARRWHSSLALSALAASVVPLALYGWIAWRAAHPAPFQWPVEPTFHSWWMHVRGAAYTYFIGGFSPSIAEWQLIRAAVLPWVLPGMLLGIAVALRSRLVAVRWGLLALLTGAAFQIAFIVSYGVTDPSKYFLPTLMVGLLAGTPAVIWIARHTSVIVGVLLVLALTFGMALWSIPRALRERANLVALDQSYRRAWASIPFDRGIVLYADDHYHRFVALQQLERLRPNLYVDNPDMLIWPIRRRAFKERFGFDPLADIEFRTAADINRIPEVVREHADVPVLVLPQ